MSRNRKESVSQMMSQRYGKSLSNVNLSKIGVEFSVMIQGFGFNATDHTDRVSTIYEKTHKKNENNNNEIKTQTDEDKDKEKDNKNANNEKALDKPPSLYSQATAVNALAYRSESKHKWGAILSICLQFCNALFQVYGITVVTTGIINELSLSTVEVI